MSPPLGRDGGQIALDRFRGRLNTATLTREISGAYDPDNPMAGPSKTTAVYTCDAYAFNYEQKLLDESTRVRVGDYIVTILRKSFVDSNNQSVEIVPRADDRIDVPPPGGTANKRATVIAVESMSEALITLQVRGVPT